MENIKISIRKDDNNGIVLIPFRGTPVTKSMSLSDEGCKFLDSIGADIILHFDKEDKLTELEMIGFDI